MPSLFTLSRVLECGMKLCRDVGGELQIVYLDNFSSVRNDRVLVVKGARHLDNPGIVALDLIQWPREWKMYDDRADPPQVREIA